MSLGGRWGGAQGELRRCQTTPNHAVSQIPAARDATARIGGAGAGWRVAAPAAWNPPEVEGERLQDAPNGGGEEEVRLKGVDDGYLRGIRVLFSA